MENKAAQLIVLHSIANLSRTGSRVMNENFIELYEDLDPYVRGLFEVTIASFDQIVESTNKLSKQIAKEI